jgi:hypothetical protein
MCRTGTAYLCRQYIYCTVQYCSKHELYWNDVIYDVHHATTVWTAEKSMLSPVMIDCTEERRNTG